MSSTPVAAAKSRVLMTSSFLLQRTQRFSRADVAPAKKFLTSWNHGLFSVCAVLPAGNRARCGHCGYRATEARVRAKAIASCPVVHHGDARASKGSGRAFIWVVALEFFNPVRRWRRRRAAQNVNRLSLSRLQPLHG